ncbi:hypothetical protein ID852_15560 [Xenorhabdus sp. 42]|uniref:hypothetical protein n=1 Tax=Xenorhabdus szentirmaii TaxID=290112 RepID=UPI00199D3FA3|nr:MULTISPECIES: hypothetical protein [unclassified Xenorhabdus]MBD2782739.1 hypothetical protein [Xenorhabdus sp. 38]MBD2805898.1 hypothetical protein [Xenorhabdus sp. ZM]MBD2822076.1 hypothetical protein [Xenorhabdus sp. 42]
MFKLIVITTNQRTGEVKKETIRYKYKTLRGAEKAALRIRHSCIPDDKSIDVEIVRVYERRSPISLAQAMHNTGLATFLFGAILEKAKDECSIDLNNLIALACDINQDVYHALCAAVYGEE